MATCVDQQIPRPVVIIRRADSPQIQERLDLDLFAREEFHDLMQHARLLQRSPDVPTEAVFRILQAQSVAFVFERVADDVPRELVWRGNDISSRFGIGVCRSRSGIVAANSVLWTDVPTPRPRRGSKYVIAASYIAPNLPRTARDLLDIFAQVSDAIRKLKIRHYARIHSKLSSLSFVRVLPRRETLAGNVFSGTPFGR
mgnify:CR=1 FL=1